MSDKCRGLRKGTRGSVNLMRAMNSHRRTQRHMRDATSMCGISQSLAATAATSLFHPVANMSAFPDRHLPSAWTLRGT